jgi:hypothetical protein
VVVQPQILAARDGWAFPGGRSGARETAVSRYDGISTWTTEDDRVRALTVSVRRVSISEAIGLD